VFPFEIGIPVGVGIGGISVELEIITAQVSHQINGILCIDDMADVHTGIIKICSAVCIVELGIWWSSQSGISRSETRNDGSLVFLQRSFNAEFAYERADTCRAGPFLLLPSLSTSIRKITGPPYFSGMALLYDSTLLLNRDQKLEKPKHETGLYYGGIIIKDQVLICCTTSYVKTHYCPRPLK
jgi:hypothetical protein